MATIEELLLRISADTSALQGGMNRAVAITAQAGRNMGRSLDTVRQAAVGLGAALATGAFASFAKRAVDTAGHINDLAQQIGFSASTLSALETSLAATGASLDDFTMANSLLQNALGEAAKGGQEQIKTFDELGLSVRSLQRLTPEDQFYAVVEALAQVDEQYRQTEIGRSLFGRGFARLLPLLKESKGDLRGLTEEQQRLKEGLGGETLARVDAFGDAMSTLGIRIRNDFLTAFAQIAPEIDTLLNRLTQVPSVVRAAFVDIPFAAGQGIGNYLSGRGLTPSMPRERQNLDDLQASLNRQLEAKGLVASKNGAKGSNAGLLKPELTEAQKQAENELNDRLQERAKLMEQNRTAYEVLVDDSIRANDLLADDQDQRNRELQRAWEEYVSSTEQGTEDASKAVEELAVSIRDSLSNSFERAIFDAKNFGDSLTSIFDGIARQIARTAFIDPLAGGITDAIKGSGALSGIGDFFGGFFAEGGTLSPGQWGIAGENGPEPIYAGNMPLTVFPNRGGGGQQIVVNQTINLSPGLPETVATAIMNARPMFREDAKNAVFSAIQRGGPEAQLVGRRN
jgi:hypothetical protein